MSERARRRPGRRPSLTQGASLAGALLCAAGCGSAPSATTRAPQPRAESRGPLHGTLPGISADFTPAPSASERITVRYPSRDATVATDSTFVFGQLREPSTTLTINGAAVPVESNGAFLAYLPVPGDGLYRFQASGQGGEAVDLVWPVNGAVAPDNALIGESVAQPGDSAQQGDSVQPLDTGTRDPQAASAGPTLDGLTPSGYTLALPGEPVDVGVRAPASASVWLHFPDGRTQPLRRVAVTGGSAGFGQATAQARTTRYQVTIRAQDGLDGAIVMAAAGGDTSTVALPRLDILETGTSHAVEVRTARPDSTAIGRATLPPGTPYHWFLPNGTRGRVTGVRDGYARLRLTEDLSTWIGASDLVRAADGQPFLAPGDGAPPIGSALPAPPIGSALPDPPPGHSLGDAYSVRAVPERGWVDVRVGLSERLPFRVDARDDGLDITVYGARTRTNWTYQAPADPDVRRVWWEQADDERYVVHVETESTPWGWDVRWAEGATLAVRVRRPPAIDPAEPLRGLYVGVDAGHADDTGAIGPTGLREGEANRAVAKRLIAMLEERGARVLETRPDAADVGLGARPLMATEAGVDVLVSVHNNAFPDGVNPFESAGTSVLYNTWQSLDLARALQRELVEELGLRDLGPIWGDLALARPTWMPSVLTETMFLMVPVQEAALRNPDAQERIAAAHVRGLEAFLRRRVGAGSTPP